MEFDGIVGIRFRTAWDENWGFGGGGDEAGLKRGAGGSVFNCVAEAACKRIFFSQGHFLLLLCSAAARVRNACGSGMLFYINPLGGPHKYIAQNYVGCT